MDWLNIIGFLIIGFFALFAIFAVLFIIVCVFDGMMEKSLKSEGYDECNEEENKRSAT